MQNLGNQIYGIINAGRAQLFEQSELAELTYSAFEIAVGALKQSAEESITVTFPVGWRPDDRPIPSSRTYPKEELFGRYQFLAQHQLAVNGIIQLATITEAILADIVRAVVMRYPKKLGAKRNVPMHVVLESASIEDIHLRATDTLLNELSYKSPAEFAESMKELLSVNLLECPAFQRFVEMKATRDIYIHNQGIANDTYVRKSGPHVRVRAGMKLPVDIRYFMQSYESCLQLTEWLEKEMHERWNSSEYELYAQRQMKLQLEHVQAAPVLESRPSIEIPELAAKIVEQAEN